MPEPPVRQIGFVTRDLEGALKNWLQIGVGPWFVLRDQVQTGRYRGNETTTTLSLALANSGDLQFEVIQPEDDTPSVFTEFLQAGREGLQQVAFWPEDYDAHVARTSAKGWPLVWSSDDRKGTRFSYFQPPQGPVVEIMEQTASTLGLAKLVADAARDWDGSEPIRSLRA